MKKMLAPEKQAAARLSRKIKATLSGPMKIMEVCGTHTMSIFRSGIRSILPEELELISGPGCPVCVTGQKDIDTMIALSSAPDLVVATFGDLMRVPGTTGTLAQARAEGNDVRMVYSPSEAIELARNMPQKHVVFLGIGFETTAPAVAASILQAHTMQLENFSVYSCHKLMPPALHALFESHDSSIDGLLCPGHVSSITGTGIYESIAKKFDLPCVVAGFEPTDILQGIYRLVRQNSIGTANVENAYERAVTREGNQNAIMLMEKVFAKNKAYWRGLGEIEGSGLEIRKEFARFDAEFYFEIESDDNIEPTGCICGEIIKAMMRPADCPLFASKCTPVTPFGPCMVSSEGACAAYYRYGNGRLDGFVKKTLSKHG